MLPDNACTKVALFCLFYFCRCLIGSKSNGDVRLLSATCWIAVLKSSGLLIEKRDSV